MICRLAGKIESVEGTSVVLRVEEGVCYEILVPAFMAAGLASRAGERVQFTTLQYLEGQGQGTSFIPRLIGFESTVDRRFFELFTTVKGIGNRKALRAMAVQPAEIAGAIVAKDVRGLTKLPEIGKRLAETIIAELTGKVEAFLSVSDAAVLEAKSGATPPAGSDPIASDAVEALIALGETRPDAEVLVSRAVARAPRDGRAALSVESLLDLVFAARAR